MASRFLLIFTLAAAVLGFSGPARAVISSDLLDDAYCFPCNLDWYSPSYTWGYVCWLPTGRSDADCYGVPRSALPVVPGQGFGWAGFACTAASFPQFAAAHPSPGLLDVVCSEGSVVDPGYVAPAATPPAASAASSASAAGMSYSTQVGAYVMAVGCVLCVGLGFVAGQQR